MMCVEGKGVLVYILVHGQKALKFGESVVGITFGGCIGTFYTFWFFLFNTQGLFSLCVAH